MVIHDLEIILLIVLLVGKVQEKYNNVKDSEKNWGGAMRDVHIRNPLGSVSEREKKTYL